ncbi:uncharacterized protein CG45076-like isoform X1 [Zophobas morio]|uniref:uncharacterized protein CG45076-like isoform X1 n=1 Tax=Zophobas morio TaxID=2755281 RepID=UPI00308296B8
MVYESDFYTTRRPYRSSPAYSTYTTSPALSRQVRILPGLGKVHVVHSYDRIVPYVGHKRLTVVTLPPKIYSTRSSVLQREYDWIESKVRPWVAYSPTNRYLNSDSTVRYVYVNNPLRGLNYRVTYKPSEYYNYYRIIRPLSSYDDYWSTYRHYYHYWPSYYKTYSNLDDLSLYRPLKLARKYTSLTGYYPDYYKYSWPLSYWPYSNYYIHYRPEYRYSTLYNDFWRNYVTLTALSPRRSLYWLKYHPMYMGRLSPNVLEYLQSIFDDETRLIRAQTASLLKQIHLPVPRIRNWPITPLNRYGDFVSLPAKYSNDTYIHRLLTFSPNSKIQYATYYTEPVKKYIGQGHLSCVSYAGGKPYDRRRPLTMYEDALKNDIQLLSYYITKFRQEKAQPKEIKVPLSASRPSRIFSVQKPIEDPVAQEIKDLREARAARLAKIYDSDVKSTTAVETNLKSKRKEEEARLAEERAIAEEQAKKAAQAKKEEAAKEAARKAELARQEQLAAQAAAERAAELERQAEKARQEELAKQAELLKARQLEEERIRQEEEQRRIEEELKAEEERKQLLRLEELARQAEEEKEAELARQAEELAELARQEAERAEAERLEREQKEKERRENELAELARQEAELAELQRQEEELAAKAAEDTEISTQETTEQPEAEIVEDTAEVPKDEEQPAEVEQTEEPIVTEQEDVISEAPATGEDTVVAEIVETAENPDDQENAVNEAEE